MKTMKEMKMERNLLISDLDGTLTNKSLVLGRFDFIPDEYEMNFLLGVFDGDGSVG